MKKVFLLLAAAICATTSSFAVTYELNGGQYNPYGWTDKDDMLQAFLTDGGAAECTLTIADFQAMIVEGKSTDGLHSPGLCTYLTSTVVANAYANTEKLGWLETYVKSKYDGVADVTYSAGHYGAGAFFISGQSVSWPKSPSFAEYGKEENYFPAWGFNYGNPSNPTEKVTLYRPFKTDWHFEGWFDNAEFNGEPITTIDETFKGTLYAKWIVWTGVELPVVEENKLVNVYTINGVCVMKNADEEAIKSLTPGFYIVGNQKRLIK